MFSEFLKVWKKKNLTAETVDEAIKMLLKTREMFVESVWSLRESPTGELRLDVYQHDKAINKLERDIRKKLMTHLMIFDKSEVIAGLTLASVVIDIERIGDYTKNIADLAIQHKQKLHAAEFEETVVSIENRVKDFFEWTIKAFPESDVELARKVVNQYKDVSRDSAIMDNTLVKGECNFSISDAVTLALYARFLKRIAAHLYNICTSIVNPFHRIGFKEKSNELN
ncbi:MAG: PhoU domain-containing protein [Candidatus Neomarinimicrobiota bacterium]